jgi:MFS family permease
LALVIYGISSLRRGHQPGALSSSLVPLALAAALLVTFVAYARRRPLSALLDLRMFRRRVVGAALGTYILASIAAFGGQLLLPLYYQQLRGHTAAQAGLLLAPQGLGMLLTMPRIGKLTDRYDPGKLVIGGVLLTLVGTVVFARVSTTTSPWLLGASLVVRGAGLGATNNPALATVYRRLPKSEVANATTALNVFQRMGAPLGTALMAVVLAWRVSVAASLADAFAQTFAVSLAVSALTLVPAAFLVNPRRQ